jgi:hypothetical protein
VAIVWYLRRSRSGWNDFRQLPGSDLRAQALAREQCRQLRVNDSRGGSGIPALITIRGFRGDSHPRLPFKVGSEQMPSRSPSQRLQTPLPQRALRARRSATEEFSNHQDKSGNSSFNSLQSLCVFALRTSLPSVVAFLNLYAARVIRSASIPSSAFHKAFAALSPAFSARSAAAGLPSTQLVSCCCQTRE